MSFYHEISLLSGRSNANMPMVQELLSRVLRLKQHIVLSLLFLISSSITYSQSVLLPADVVIVSVNSNGDSFDFIPLVHLEEGTTIWFSNGIWNPETSTVEEGQEIQVVLKSSIEAGTNIHINEIEDPRVEVKGHLDFTGVGDRILAYQKDEGIARVVYGIGWGNNDIWNAQSESGSAIPSSISKENHSFLQLGNFQNYQYYLRNGASGTPTMLASFVGDPAKWKGRNNISYNSFGTAFRILNPPVVLFDESISTTKESESIILNVAIFEHDGSRLTVDAVFNEFSSTADTNDISKFKKHTFNFTGLIGDAVYAVEIPISDDRVYESTENVFFELQNLSKGEFGDFITHVAFIPDNEIPKVQITNLSYVGNPDSDYIEIQSNERIDADLSGWKLESRGELFKFPYGTYISPLQTIKIVHPQSKTGRDKASLWLRRGQGIVELKNEYGELVSNLDFRLSVPSEDRINTKGVSVADAVSEEVAVATISNEQKTSMKLLQENRDKLAGWYTTGAGKPLSVDVKPRDLYAWDEESGSFTIVKTINGQVVDQRALLGYYSDEEINIETDATDTLNVEAEDESEPYIGEWVVSLSATDSDQNGVINGTEGFNFIRNTSPNEVSVHHLIETLETSLFEGAIYPYIFLWKDDGQGWMTAEKLSFNDFIPANASFWVKADSAFEKTEVAIEVKPYLEQPQIVDETIRNESELQITLETTTLAKSISMFFFEDLEGIKRDVLVPALEPELKVNGDDFLFFGAGSGLNWNSEIYLESIQDQKMMFPLTFEASESGTFKLSVKKFDGIPADWKISLLDEISLKEYELDSNWNLEFEHMNTQENKTDEGNKLNTREEGEVQELEPFHRFMLSITPPEAQEASDLIPEVVSLNQNYPNPFNPVTTISFYLPEPVPVKLSVFNVVGQPVAVLTEGTLGAGDHEFEWDASGLPSGMYIYQLEVGTKVMTRKMTLVK